MIDSGPVSVQISSQERALKANYCHHTPEEYAPILTKFGVKTIIRLNKKEYDRNQFVQDGFKHYDLYFLDGSVPPENILKRFLEIAESEEGTIAGISLKSNGAKI